MLNNVLTRAILQPKNSSIFIFFNNPSDPCVHSLCTHLMPSAISEIGKSVGIERPVNFEKYKNPLA